MVEIGAPLLIRFDLDKLFATCHTADVLLEKQGVEMGADKHAFLPQSVDDPENVALNLCKIDFQLRSLHQRCSAVMIWSIYLL